VNPNADGVQDVKHRLRVGGIWVRYFWEASEYEPAVVSCGDCLLLACLLACLLGSGLVTERG
jgi:hypothetical protein